MSIVSILIDVVVMAAITVVVMVLIGVFARRVLGVRIGLVRVVLAGIVGLVAEIGFESQLVWRSDGQYSLALIPVQLGIIVLVSIAFLVFAELVMPQGTVPRPTQLVEGLRQGADRGRRYTELVRIATRNRLVPFKVNTEISTHGMAERAQQAASLTAALEQAGGAFVKLGQLMSTRTDVLPQEYTDALSRLQQAVPPAPWDEVVEVLAAGLRRDPAAVFAHIDPEPVAAASIGQVHLATLRTGERVAVKIQRPGIVPLVERDIDIALRIADRLVQSTAWARRFGLDEIAVSLTDSLRDELDYRIEASNIAALEEVESARPVDVRVHIPHYHSDLSSQTVLVMEYVEGATLSDPQAVADLSASQRKAMAGLLLRATLSQIMDAGVFHADLHPGNVMITPHRTLALLDFGSVGRLDSEVRGQVAEILLAFSRGDARAFADTALGFVELPDDLDEYLLRRQIGDFMSRHLGPGATLDATTFTHVVAILSSHGLAMPTELTNAFRSIATVEGTLRVLDPGYEFVTGARAYATERIAAARRPRAIAESVVDEALDLLPMVRRLPRRIDRITGQLADGRLGVNVRLLADKRDRVLLREFINLAALAFLAGVFGVMAAMLLVSSNGPQLTPDLSLFQVFGYLMLIVAGILGLRVLFDILRPR